MLIYLFVIIAVLVTIWIIRREYLLIRPLKNIQGPKEYFILGSALELFLSPVELFNLGRRYAKQFPNLYKFKALNLVTLNIYNPEDIEKIVSTTRNIRKSVVYKFLRPWLQSGLLLSKGQKWHDRRKILTPAFHFNILRNFCAIFDEVSKKMTDVIQEKVGEPIDITPIITELTLTVICGTAMGTKIKANDLKWKKYRDAVFKLGDLFIRRFTNIPLFFDPIFQLSQYQKQQIQAIDNLHSFTRDIIKERTEYLKNDLSIPKETNEGRQKRTPMLDQLLAAQDKGQIDGAGIQEEVDNFMFAGHDTTACALTFCLMALAQQEHIQKVLPRTVCNIHIYDLHRREDLFPNPELFDPDRFLPENCVGRHPYAYIPFSAGPRNCIGQKYAMLLLKSILSSILRRYQLLPVTAITDVVHTADLILRNSGPVEVTFINRNTKDNH